MIRGMRGAITVNQNTEEAIITATEELLEKIIEENHIQPELVASVFISTTEDINAVFPAKALRKFEGWTYVPVMCMQEMPVPNSLKMCVRIMMHVNTTQSQEDINHVYLKGAKVLRPDLSNSLA
ncbi:chorismate mutase [Bacillus sp. ISL-40]|uniref:chorismate mutase n=1 Tax=unclassified Bacillus (in: firmicutes) TaxID=185979 RepID=UPI001BE9D668|nr:MULTISPECIES: chorismate mutase [unclassified Bacillus (in: firmicutes)]MBT2701453.1 chorismate mutase [Bacillus sp. ISL-40]MBT2724623.1 chorismate mutase [Bacillus sp. ISL-46]MBT2726281.1 chorismate mutase [Bacillus sp. ISL-75]MBT2743394.1 chorismate mutase [Bacillus sp. ISL-77]